MLAVEGVVPDSSLPLAGPLPLSAVLSFGRSVERLEVGLGRMAAPTAGYVAD